MVGIILNHFKTWYYTKNISSFENYFIFFSSLRLLTTPFCYFKSMGTLSLGLFYFK